MWRSARSFRPAKDVTNLVDPEILRVVVGADGAAVLRHRRHHGGELRAAGAGGRGFWRWSVAFGTIPMAPAAGVRALNAAIAAAQAG